MITIKCLWKLTFEDINTGKSEIKEYVNLVTTAGKTMLAQRLAGEANDCNLTYVAVGTGTTAPAVTDTTLETELARKALASVDYSGAVVIARGYFGASEGNGTLTEIGLFGEAASATPDSGTLFNHAVISETKTSSKTLTTETTITVS